MKKFLALTVVLLILWTISGSAFADATVPDAGAPVLDAGAYILIDALSGEVLIEKDSENKSLYPASTTKMMTAILALEKGDLVQEMTASQSAIDDIGPDGSNIGINPGETVKLENLLQALLISSANEAANIIAENICTTKAEFVALMNQRAKELGCTHTHFANPCGYHDPNHYTTASDLAKIARYAMTLPKFREIVGTKTYQMPVTNKHAEWPVLANTNKLMIQDKNDLYVINGIKTGYTGPAGYNLVSSGIDSNGLNLIAVVMDVTGSEAQERVRTYSKALLDYGFNNFIRMDLAEKNTVYQHITVEDAADEDGLDLLLSDNLVTILPKETSQQNIRQVPHLHEGISAPVNIGDLMGYVEYYKNDVLLARINLIAARNIEPQPFSAAVKSTLANVLNHFAAKALLAFSSFVLFFLLLRFTLRRISRSVRRRRY